MNSFTKLNEFNLCLSVYRNISSSMDKCDGKISLQNNETRQRWTCIFCRSFCVSFSSKFSFFFSQFGFFSSNIVFIFLLLAITITIEKKSLTMEKKCSHADKWIFVSFRKERNKIVLIILF